MQPVLGIETSCDETASAVLDGEGRVLAEAVLSQEGEHAPYGGVVPEIAARAHLAFLPEQVARVMARAGVGFAELGGVAASGGPGLIGGLIVGSQFAKGIAIAHRLPYVAVNHLEAHALTARLPGLVDGGLAFPYLLLLVSGGHCQCVAVEGVGRHVRLGSTMDDAAGEAFDKVAKLLGLGYPGGPIIDRLAPHGDANAVKFLPAQIKHRDRREHRGKNATEADRERFDFSYSGIKTAVLRYVETHEMRDAIDTRRKILANTAKPGLEDYLANSDKATLDLVASFQRAMVADLVGKTLAAGRAYDVATLFVTGGVAANNELRTTFESESAQEGLQVYFPSRPLSTDNAAMIAAAAYPKFLAKDFAAMDFNAEAGLVLR